MVMSYIEELEKEAQRSAITHVSNLLQRSDQLEKIDHYKKRELRKKLSVEAMLKTALQNQLDRIRIGMQKLKEALDDSNIVEESMEKLVQNLDNVPHLVQELSVVQQEQIKYSQYVVTMQNLKHIYDVPESTNKIRKLIEEEKYLHAHHNLSELELSRNDLLLEIHNLPQQRDNNLMILSSYFSEVEALYDLLGKQLWLCLSRTLNTVRKEPTVIVTAIRIVEREEKLDENVLLIHKEKNFLPPGRPRRFRQKALSVLKDAVNERLEGCHCESRSDNKMWLVRHLEMNRQIILEDLRVVKLICSFCFPPHYEIFKTYVKMYHESMRSHNIRVNYVDWLKKMLEGEVKEWNSSHPPEKDSLGCYHTTMPIIVSNIVDQNLQVAATISMDLTQEVMLLSLDAAVDLCRDLQMQVKVYKSRHFMDRNQLQFFTHYMIAIANNCHQLLDSMYLLFDQRLHQGLHNEMCKNKFEEMKTAFVNMRNEAIQVLLEEAFLDMEPHFADLLSKKNPQSTVAIDTIIVTLEDYFQDYIHLNSRNFELAVWEAQEKVVLKYIHSMLQKKIVFKGSEDKTIMMDRVKEDSQKLKKLFQKISPKVETSTCQVISDLADVIRVKDPELVSLELHSFISKYRDVSPDQLIALLSMRGDLSRSEVRQLVADILSRKVQDSNPFALVSILSKLPPLSRTLFEINVS